MPQTLKLLVMEDDPTFLDVLCLSLKDRGYHPIPCAAPHRFHELVAQSRPDLILLDAHLKGSADGLQLCGTLKQDRKTQDIPVLMMSGVFAGEFESKAKARGALAFLQKPFECAQ